MFVLERATGPKTPFGSAGRANSTAGDSDVKWQTVVDTTTRHGGHQRVRSWNQVMVADSSEAAIQNAKKGATK